MYRVFISSFFAPSINKFTKEWQSGQFPPITILDGNKLSLSALPSLKNSGEKTIWVVLFFLFKNSVCPNGIVDLITIKAFLLLNQIYIYVNIWK